VNENPQRADGPTPHRYPRRLWPINPADPVSQLSERRPTLAGTGWAPANSTIEYRFFRVSWPEGALLVDFIWRRRAASAEVRVSCFQNGGAAVHRSVEEREPDLPQHRPHRRMPPGPARIHVLRRPGVVGSAVPPEPGGFSVPPGPLRWSEALDLSLASRPACAITGRIGVDGVEYRPTEQPAMTCHYWGRNLPPQWVWLSGNDFDRP